MLYKETVAPKTFELLVRLQQEDITESMRLVGGTALALQIAHRTSTDLDLFSQESFNVQEALELLINEYGFVPSYIGKQTIVGFIDDIKIDLISHPYQWLAPPVSESDVRIAGLDDIAAMKLHAIANSGERPKDFLDIAFLSTRYSYNEIKRLALRKYPVYDAIMLDKSINYFCDVDRKSIEDIHLLRHEMNWDAIEHRLISMTEHPDKIFSRPPLHKK